MQAGWYLLAGGERRDGVDQQLITQIFGGAGGYLNHQRAVGALRRAEIGGQHFQTVKVERAERFVVAGFGQL